MGAAIARRIVLALLLLALGCGGFVLAGALGWLGRPEGPGTIAGERLPAARIQERAAAQRQAARAAGASAAKQILFGDLHVHTTFSLDAFMMRPADAAGGEGAHPPADACDFARYCSALDFWSINDHAEALTPRIGARRSSRSGSATRVAGDPRDPDMVAFLGWEWTQVGPTPETTTATRT